MYSSWYLESIYFKIFRFILNCFITRIGKLLENKKNNIHVNIHGKLYYIEVCLESFFDCNICSNTILSCPRMEGTMEKRTYTTKAKFSNLFFVKL